MSSRTVPKKREQYQSPTDIVRVLRFSASNKLPLPCMLTSISSHRGTASSCITKSRVSSAPRSSGKAAAQPEEKSSVRGLKACAVRKHVFAERAHAARDRSLSFFSGKRIARSRKCVKPSEVGDVFSRLLSQPLYDRQGARRRRTKQKPLCPPSSVRLLCACCRLRFTGPLMPDAEDPRARSRPGRTRSPCCRPCCQRARSPARCSRS